MSQIRLMTAIECIRGARENTQRLMSDFTADEWFWHPPTFVTHLAWQIGHIAYAQYCHCFWWIRGRRPEDSAWMPERFIELFEMGSVPVAAAEVYPSTGEIKRVLDAVFEQAMSELSTLTDEALDVAIHPSRPERTKLKGLFWNVEHEFLHGGQIALLRRLMGKPPMP
jgi:DinB family protein